MKVSYFQNWDCEGYHTTQNIKISENFLQTFNEFLTSCRGYVKNKPFITSAEANLLMYGKNIENLNKCLTHTQLLLLCYFLKLYGIGCERIKTDRNTMIIIAD